MRHEESVELGWCRKIKHAGQIGSGHAAGANFFERQGLKRPSPKVFRTEPLGEPVGNTQDHILDARK
jgi:hypothetical protein